MFERLLEAARELEDASVLPDAPELLLPAVPDEFTLDDVRSLATEVQDKSVSSASSINPSDLTVRVKIAYAEFCFQDTTAVLAAVYVVLKSDKVGIQLNDDGAHNIVLEDIALRVGQMMVPVCSGATFDQDSTDYASLSHNGLLGLQILILLLPLTSRGGLVLPTGTLLSVIAFSNRDDPWASSSCSELARSLLSDYFQTISPPQATKPKPVALPPPRSTRDAGAGSRPSEKTPKTEQARFITEDVLTGFLRPLFAKSRPSTVTASGRPAAFPEPPSRYSQGDGFGGADDVTVTKPWKYTQRYAVTVFEWAVEIADTDLIQGHWPLYTPILLTLLDEPQPTSLKLRALSIFRKFWRLCPEGLLSRTGLVNVFEEAVFPTVLSLPSLTPEDESCDLLAAAYPALFDMAGLKDPDSGVAKNRDVRAENTNDQEASDKRNLHSTRFSEAQRKLFDKLVREGIMVGYHHAKQHIRLVEFFCQTLRRLVIGMGILSVKYLKDIVPMISEILVDPFGTKYPPVLLSATHLLQAVLQTCWPRMPHYCNEIIKIAMLCWLNIEDEESFPPNKPTKAELKLQLTKAIEMLSAIMAAAKQDMSDRVCPLIAKDPQLRGLFTGYEAK
ncbi:hypothetical protein EKO27_g2072 [Xylaria grammica]|uniref:Uncharacterized protein n=1 Tax=Xylaria grammica TaxID=363999 RepID=A0A439DF80_9PEZI|nr:hypothetical protein EKO27_g2072 [Xylaria grammica]